MTAPKFTPRPPTRHPGPWRADDIRTDMWLALRAAEKSLAWHLETKGRAVGDDLEALAAVRAALAKVASS